MASGCLTVEVEPGNFQLANHFAISEAGQAAHLGGNNDSEIRLTFGCREVLGLVVFPARLNQFSRDIAGDFESLRDRAPLGDEALQFMGRRQINAFGEFFDLNRDG